MKPEVIENDRQLARMAAHLATTDHVLASIHERLGPPPLWGRKPGLATLVHIVLEQQVSLASGRAAFAKLKNACGGRVGAARIVQLGERGLRDKARLTRQKSRYVLAIAQANQARKLKFRSLESLPDEQVREQLMQIKGIGTWTSDIYLLMALRRADVMPLGDLALELEVAEQYGLADRPDNEALLKHAETWRPYRAAAARMLWHSYLDRLGRHNEI